MMLLQISAKIFAVNRSHRELSCGCQHRSPSWLLMECGLRWHYVFVSWDCATIKNADDGLLHVKLV